MARAKETFSKNTTCSRFWFLIQLGLFGFFYMHIVLYMHWVNTIQSVACSYAWVKVFLWIFNSYDSIHKMHNLIRYMVLLCSLNCISYGMILSKRDIITEFCFQYIPHNVVWFFCCCWKASKMEYKPTYIFQAVMFLNFNFYYCSLIRPQTHKTSALRLSISNFRLPPCPGFG